MEHFDKIWATPEFVENTNMKIIDIRTEGEWTQTGIVDGAYTITLFNEFGGSDVEGFIEELDKIVSKDEAFALICRTGARTGQAADFLRNQKGYNAVSLIGGMIKLIGEGYTPTPYRK